MGYRLVSNYILLAFRNLSKNKLYATINIGGLALGLMIYIFGSIIVEYEENHDHMFPKRDQIFTVGSIFAEHSGENILEYPNVRLAYAPLFKKEIKEMIEISRVVLRLNVITSEQTNKFFGVRFADDGFTNIFDFNYLYGDKTALDSENGVIITESTALELFGSADVLGKEFLLNNNYSLIVNAIIKDIAADSQFNSSYIPDTKLTIIASMKAFISETDFKEEGEWTSLEPTDMTFVLLKKNATKEWFQKEVDRVHKTYTPKEQYSYISALKVTELKNNNLSMWSSFGFPIMESISLISLLVLITACLNYTNLGTAQSFGRTREIGLRKTFGAEKRQLITQFLTESFIITLFSMIVAIAAIELIIPFYNNQFNRALSLNYLDILPWLIVTVIIVGVCSGAYSALFVSNLKPINSLKSILIKSPLGNTFRSFMIALQFSISIFLLAMALIIYFQNEKAQGLSTDVPKKNILIVQGIHFDQIKEKRDIFINRVLKLEDVSSVSLSNSIPYWDSGLNTNFKHVVNSKDVKLTVTSIDDKFFSLYNVNLIAGRDLNSMITNDNYDTNRTEINVVINQLAAQNLGLPRDGSVIGKSFYRSIDSIKYTIVGLKKDDYFFGMQSKIKPNVFYINNDLRKSISIGIDGSKTDQIIKDITIIWNDLYKNHPIQINLLDFYFSLLFGLLNGINMVLALFTVVALCLGLVGLFGLAAFMSQRRTKEIGLRKIMGATVSQVVRLLILQFSKPVMWAILISTPLIYITSDIYINFFPEKIETVIPIIILACGVSILISWLIVSVHAFKIAKAKPIHSLRYE
jgi:putative ABC transport system permease protein